MLDYRFRGTSIFAAVIFALLSFSATRLTADDSDRNLAEQVAATLKEMKDQGRIRDFDLEIMVSKKTVTVTGRVASPSHARLVMDAILGAGHVQGIVLHIGIGKAAPPQPAVVAFPNNGAFPNYGAEMQRLRHRKLEWNDGHSKLDFSQPGHVKVK